jgi:hypothetical protein
MTTVTVSSKRQITLPADVRLALSGADSQDEPGNRGERRFSAMVGWDTNVLVRYIMQDDADLTLTPDFTQDSHR